jgi:hypothetical protein
LRYVVAAFLVQRVSQTVLAAQRLEGLQYPLTWPFAPAWQRQWHDQHVLQPIVRAIQETYWNQAAQRAWFHDLLSSLQVDGDDRHAPDVSYAAGIVLTLKAALKLSLTETQLSALRIRYADLWEANLSGMTITACQFSETTFPVYLSGTLVADMSADGQAIAIGDAAGRVAYWGRTGDRFSLQRYHRFRALADQSVAIAALALDQHDVLVLAAGQTIYRWWTGGEATPDAQFEVDGAVKCLAHRGDYMAVGLTDGHLWMNDRFTTATRLKAHLGAVSLLAFDADGFELVSIGTGNRALRWDLMANPGPAIRDALSAEGRILRGAQWRNEQLILAGTVEGQAVIQPGEAAWTHLKAAVGIDKLVFSRNGAWLVGLDRHSGLYLWNCSFELVHQVTLPVPAMRPDKLAISDDGSTVLTGVNDTSGDRPTTRIQVWEVATGRLIWQIATGHPTIRQVQLADNTGLLPAELQHLGEFSS